MFISRFKKPEYYWKGRGLFRQKTIINNDPYGIVTTAFGTKIHIAKSDAIGIAIQKTGMHELVVCEALWRLSKAGDIAVDVGANIGFITQLLSERVGGSGSVFSFEPNEKVFQILKINTELLTSKANIQLSQEALSNTVGLGTIQLPEGYANNSGIAQVFHTHNSESADTVKINTLDHVFVESMFIDILKIDVEGAEKDVLAGADQLLKKKAIRFIVFEDFNPFPSEVTSMLTKNGYAVFRLEKGWFGPRLCDGNTAARQSSWESVNYVAAHDFKLLKKIFSGSGYHCLKNA